MVNSEIFRQGLGALGIRAGETVIVHSSLKSFGKVEGGAETIIDTLCQVVGPEGAILMPTYSFGEQYSLSDEEKMSGFRWKIRRTPFDPKSTPCKTGIIPETFWRRKGVVRGNHPSLSFAAWGKWGDDPALLCQEVEPILDKDPAVLLLGVTINSCSVMHIAETRVQLPSSIAQRMRVPDEIRRIYPSEQWDIGFGPEPDWSLVYQSAIKDGFVRECHIGMAQCSSFKANKMVAQYERFLRDQPLALYGITE